MRALRDRLERVAAWWRVTRPARALARFGSAGGGLLTGGIAYATLFSLFAALTLGWTVFGIEWGLAAAGVITKSVAIDHFRRGRLAVISAALYLLQGWLIVFAAKALVAAVGWQCVAWLAAGGAAYTLGVVFFALDRIRYFHAAWHMFVLAGSIAHFFAILLYVA